MLWLAFSLTTGCSSFSATIVQGNNDAGTSDAGTETGGKSGNTGGSASTGGSKSVGGSNSTAGSTSGGTTSSTGGGSLLEAIRRPADRLILLVHPTLVDHQLLLEQLLRAALRQSAELRLTEERQALVAKRQLAAQQH